MIQWLLLGAAIVVEVISTLCMRVAAHGRTSFYAVVAVGYTIAFGFLAFALDAGLPLGVGYGIWAASGVALTAVACRVLFNEPLTRTMLLGIGLIVVGVLLVELGSSH